MVCQPSPSNSHYGNPHVTAFYHIRSPSSPSTFCRIFDDKASCSEQKDPEETSSETSSSTLTDIKEPSSNRQPPLSRLPLAIESSEVGQEMSFLAARTQPRLVTPNASFAERDSIENRLEMSFVDYSFPVHTPSGGGSPGSSFSWSSPTSKRASVGLPSQYPGHRSDSSLVETVREELQDFDELFLEQASASVSEDASSAFDEVGSFSRMNYRLSSMSISCTSSQQDDLFLYLALDAPAAVLPSKVVEEEDEEAKVVEPPTPPPRRGRHRRSRKHHAIDQDFLSQVMKEA